MDALLQQRAEDQIYAAKECQNPEVVVRHLQSLRDARGVLDEGITDVEEHLGNLLRRNAVLPLGID